MISSAGLTSIARVTEAMEAPVGVLEAIPGIRGMAGPRATLIEVPLTVSSRVTRGAGAPVTSHQVHTCPVM